MDIFSAIANSENFDFFKKNVKNISHSILLIGKDEQYSNLFAQLLSCLILDGKIDESCLNYQKVMLQAHPDVKYYPQKEKLLVADSQEIVAESCVKPVFASRKIFIIKNIDNSMESAQNKLLKTLEEPSADVFLILTCQNLNLVLPTIKSRCQKVEIAKLSNQQVKEYIGTCDNMDLILAVCDGQLGKALELSKKRELSDVASLAVDIFSKMTKSSQVLEYSKKIQSFEKDYKLLLEIMCIVIEDILKIKAGNFKDLKLTYFSKELKEASVNYTVKALCKIVEILNKFQKEIFYNVNNLLAMENLLLNILEVKFICK